MQQLPPGFELEPMPQTTPQPNSAPGIIRGRPKQVDPVEQQNDALRNQFLQGQIADQQRDEQKRGLEQQQEQERQASADSAARGALLKTIGGLNNIAIDADDANGWFETGTSGGFARNVLPGANAGKDLAANIQTLEAEFAFGALQAMRDASKTGGALGQVTERELDLLKSSIVNIDPGQTHESFLTNVEKARQVYLSKLAVIDPQMATRLGYDAEEAEATLLELNAAYERQFGDPNTPPPTINRDGGNQPDPNRNPDDIQAILDKYGVE